MNFKMPTPINVETVAAVMTKNNTLKGFVLLDKSREPNVPIKVVPPIKISIMPIIRIVLKCFNVLQSFA